MFHIFTLLCFLVLCFAAVFFRSIKMLKCECELFHPKAITYTTLPIMFCLQK